MLKNGTLTYISLFSSAGVGCYGFKQEGYQCIATCEILEKRLNIQKYNDKCILDSGYILGDLSSKEVKARDIFVFCAYTGLAYVHFDSLITSYPFDKLGVLYVYTGVYNYITAMGAQNTIPKFEAVYNIGTLPQ